jgi:hypothetical protein
MIINSNSRFNHFDKILKLVYLTNFIFNGIFKTVIEFRRNNVIFLI